VLQPDGTKTDDTDIEVFHDLLLKN
jgi:hypothetical protein